MSTSTRGRSESEAFIDLRQTHLRILNRNIIGYNFHQKKRLTNSALATPTPARAAQHEAEVAAHAELSEVETFADARAADWLSTLKEIYADKS